MVEDDVHQDPEDGSVAYRRSISHYAETCSAEARTALAEQVTSYYRRDDRG